MGFSSSVSVHRTHRGGPTFQRSHIRFSDFDNVNVRIQDITFVATDCIICGVLFVDATYRFPY